ncbi:MAG: cytochrome C oxidase Cbb3, partial [Desulfuromonadales bacterium]|nr:cytochrome C oxidase Cbb3 [Desulfuromonadales bacterium]NIS42567.1 cytochrome C oxidase Cbb3 [Desulfuromonadales bacterium]
PALVDTGLPDDELYRYIVNGYPEGGMPGFSSLGSKKLWQIVNYINYGEH